MPPCVGYLQCVARSTPQPTLASRGAQPTSPPRVGVACLPHLLSTNPYQRLLYEELSVFGFELIADARLKLGWMVRHRDAVRILHMHWPESYYRQPGGSFRQFAAWLKLFLFIVRIAAGRLLGYRIVWTVHQVYPHEGCQRGDHVRDRLAARLLARLSNALIAHDAETAAIADHELPGSRHKLVVVPHGSYIGVYPPRRDRAAVREELGIAADSFAFLSFGLLRGYKQLELLLEAFGGADLPRADLILAGLVVDEAAAAAVHTAAAADPRIKLLLRFVPDGEVAELFEASDAAVFARSDGGTSGALILALSLGRPVVAARTPTYARLTGGEEAAWLFDPESVDSLRAALERAAADPAAARTKAAEALARAELLHWPEIAEQTAAVMRQVLVGVPGV